MVYHFSFNVIAVQYILIKTKLVIRVCTLYSLFCIVVFETYCACMYYVYFTTMRFLVTDVWFKQNCLYMNDKFVLYMYIYGV